MNAPLERFLNAKGKKEAGFGGKSRPASARKRRRARYQFAFVFVRTLPGTPADYGPHLREPSLAPGRVARPLC